jgi:hypothetical protein
VQDCSTFSVMPSHICPFQFCAFNQTVLIICVEEMSFLSLCLLPPTTRPPLSSPFLLSFLSLFLPSFSLSFLFFQLCITSIMLFLLISLFMYFLPHETQQRGNYMPVPFLEPPYSPRLPCLWLATRKVSGEHLVREEWGNRLLEITHPDY